MNLEKELEVARRAARQAGELALRLRGRGLAAEAKADASPVTAADRECEQLLAAALSEAFPEDGLLGEEGARREPRSGRRWIIDPIDGTRDFLRGNGSWAVLIGLETDGDIAAGVCFMPERGEMYFASRGSGAWRNDDRIAISAITEPARAVLCVTGLNDIAGRPYAGRLVDWLAEFWAVRSLGGCLDAMMVASGRAEAWIEPAAEVWDLAALKVILEESGARFVNFDGGSSARGGNCIACVPALEAPLRRFLGIPKALYY